MPVTAVGFDLDGTLCVPDRDRATLLEESLGAVDGPPISREEYLDVHRQHLGGETREPIFAALLDGHDTDVSAAELAATYHARVNASLVPVDGAAALVEALRGRYRVGLLTNGPRKSQREKLAALGWGDRFDAVVISGEVGAGKPHRAAFAALLDALGSEPAATAYVGDEVEADVAGAAAAGLAAVQVCYPGGPAPDARAVAHVERDRLGTELPRVLDAL